MRLYNTEGAIQVDDPEHGTFTPDASGAFDGLPDALFAKLHGRPGWESQAERDLRVAKEELDRYRDPAELLKAVRELGANQGLLTQTLATALGLGAPAPASTPAPAHVAEPEPAVEIPADAEVETPVDAEPVPGPAAEAPVSKSRARKSASARAAASE